MLITVQVEYLIITMTIIKKQIEIQKQIFFKLLHFQAVYFGRQAAKDCRKALSTNHMSINLQSHQIPKNVVLNLLKLGGLLTLAK